MVDKCEILPSATFALCWGCFVLLAKLTFQIFLRTLLSEFESYSDTIYSGVRGITAYTGAGYLSVFDRLDI